MGAVVQGESDLPAKKTARKKRAKKSDADAAAALPTPEIAEAEVRAQAADTFDEAFEANGPGEAASSAAAPDQAVEPEKPKKGRRTKKAEPEPEAIVETPAPEPQPDGDPDDLGPDEDDEMEGDWESGTEDEEEDAEGEKQRAPLPPPRLERLQKILAAAGVASRRHAEELIAEGHVQVNGKVVTELGSKADPARDHIRVDGKLLHGAERLRYFMLNKPREYVTTVSDPEGRPTVMEFFAKMGERLYPVGRLDYQSEGLLLMTNDGDLANKLTRAASGVEKTYLVKVSGQPDEDMIDALREGIGIDRGRPGEGRVRTAPARIRQVREGENPWFEVTLIEGRNRELRKMFEEIGHHVEKIRRVGYGPLVLDLEPGQSRELDAEEVNLLRLAAEGKWKPKRVKTTSMLPKEAGRSIDHEAARRGGRPFHDKRHAGQGGQGPGRRQDWGRGSGQGGRDRGQTGDRPAFGRTQDRERGRQQGFEGRQDRGFTRGGAGRSFERRPATGEAARGSEERREGSAFRRGPQERRQGGWQPRGPQLRDQERPPRRDQERGTRQGQGFRQEGRPGPGMQDRSRGERGGFSRPQGQRAGGNRPFRGRPESASDRPRRGGTFEERPPRQDRGQDRAQGASGRLRIEEEGGHTSRPERSAPPRRQDRPQGPGQGREQGSRPGGFRGERPAPAGREERRFGSRPPRPAGGGFRPRGEGEERGGEARSGGFGERERRRPAGGSSQRETRGGFGGRDRNASGGRGSGPGNRGRSGPGSRSSSGRGAGGRGGNRPGGRGGAGRPGRGSR
jgi:23S rRNA pseudouridine2605 synthase